MVAATARDFVGRVCKRGKAIVWGIVGPDVTSVAVHETYIGNRVIVGDIGAAGEAAMPGVGPRKAPFTQEPSARGMADLGQSDAQEVVGAGALVVDAIVIVATPVEV